MLLFRLGCLRKYAEICFGKLSKICDMCKIFFTGLFFILWGVDQNSDPVMVLNRFGMMDIGVADECGSPCILADRMKYREMFFSIAVI